MPERHAPYRRDFPRLQKILAWREWLPLPRLISASLLAIGILPPIGLALLGGAAMIAAPQTAVVLVSTLVFVPVIFGVVTAVQGPSLLLARLLAESGAAYRQGLGRLLLGALILVYVFALLAAKPTSPAVASCVLLASLNLAAGWTILCCLMLELPRVAPLRQIAFISDLVLLSLLLAAGGSRTAALTPIYLYLSISYADARGLREVVRGIGLSVVAFAAVTAETPFWWDQIVLAGGMLATMIMLPAYVGSRLHRLSVAEMQAKHADLAKNRFLSMLGGDLRGALRTIARAFTEIDWTDVNSEQRGMIAEVRSNARALLLQLEDVHGYVELDTGSAAPETRSFDFHRLTTGAVAAVRIAAAECGVLLDLRIDPRIPDQLQGWPRQLRQVLIGLAASALRHSSRNNKAKVRLDLRLATVASQAATVRIAVTAGIDDTRLETVDEVVPQGEAFRHLGLAVVDRLIELMGGSLTVDGGRRSGLSLVAELPFAVDEVSPARPLDLAGLPVLIVSKDAELVDDLMTPLEAWHADPHWIGAEDAALRYLETFEQPEPLALLIIDGRGDALQSLSWTHRAAALLSSEPRHTLFIADELHIDSIIGLAGGEIDMVLPAPLALDVLRSAIHSLTVEPIDRLFAEAFPRTGEPLDPSAQRRVEGTPPAAPQQVSAVPATTAHAPPPGEELSNRRWMVLVATSNRSNLRVIGSLLSRSGHIVHLATTAEEARKKLETEEIDVLVLDLTTASGADYEAAELCRRARPSVTIIGLTSDAAEEAERRAREVGLDAVLRKPLGPRRLMSAIDAAMDKTAAQPPEPTTVVTSLSSHPRFAPDAERPSSARPTRVKSITLTTASFREAADTFHADCGRIVGMLGQAASAGDAQAFEAGLQALHNSTANLGNNRLRELLQSMRGQPPAVLQQQGVDYVQRLDVELRKLDALLVDRLRTAN